MAKRKPWRKFKNTSLKDRHVRWMCLAALAVEMGVLKGQGRLCVPVIKVTEDREVVIYQIPPQDGGAGPAGGLLTIPAKDQVYGIRIRLKEGMVDVYLREEMHDGGR